MGVGHCPSLAWIDVVVPGALLVCAPGACALNDCVDLWICLCVWLCRVTVVRFVCECVVRRGERGRAPTWANAQAGTIHPGKWAI